MKSMRSRFAVSLLAASALFRSGPATAVAAESALSPFGIGSCYINGRSAKDLQRWLPQMSAIGLRVLRTCHVAWDTVEPEEGKWAWDEVDREMALVASNKMTCGALLLGSPRWNTADKPGTLPANNLAAWSRYVTETVKHLKGRVKYFEVWNEPPNFTGTDQTPADYAKLVVAAYDAAKAVDPDCLVGLAAKSCHVNYLEQVIQAGAKDHFDWITLHPYEILDGVANHLGSEPVFLHIVPTVRKMLAAQNPARADVPILFTELGCDAQRKGADTQAHTLVKAYAMGIAQGVACIQWFEGMDGDSGPMGLLQSDGIARPAYTALAQMIQHLGQHPKYLGWITPSEGTCGFLFQGPTNSVLVAWNRHDGSQSVRFSRAVPIVDPLTGKSSTADRLDLTVAPVLIVGVPEDLVAEARRHHDQPLPWGGDYSKAKSVSVTMGEHNVEHGLHTFSGAGLAEAVVAYGGSARAGSVPGGNVFMVDPGFLSYDTVPIEITAVVRRNAANDNAGFKLIYESKTGLKTAGNWYTVPDNKQWHTARWVIDDPQFVSYWGYNFALESDGNVYNRYLIQSITVTKLPR
jgi:polysaccharide biosynthesis protein PslG